MAEVDFSRAASTYDRRPGGGPMLAPEAARAIADGLPSGAAILDVGAGTGRVTLTLTSLGFRVTALDPARAMLETLRAKAEPRPTRLVRAEGASLPFASDSFDAVVLSRILYLMSDWRTVLREVVRVLAPGGRLLHEWGNGSPDEEWVQIRERARALFEQEGIRDPFHPGVRSEEEVDRCLAEHGLAVVSQVPLGPGPSIPLSDFLQKIDEGDCSYVWSVPVAIQQRCLPELRAWAAERFDLEQPIPFPREIRWTIFRR
ncbi:MAG TPA: class I SAM-dependent methyltransferase [Vicinamibacterales bacterium]|nr:class I SAM-dependent methyltransferase [Vicinamibacterales bacterium]